MSVPSLSEFDKLALTLGRVAIKWNDIQFFIFAIFSSLLGSNVRAHATFFAIRTDRAQRDMTASLAKAVLGDTKDDDLQKRVVKFLEEVGRMAGRRNDVLHGMWYSDHPELFPKLFGASAPRLSAKNIPEELSKLLTELDELHTKAVFLSTEVREAMEGPTDPSKSFLGQLASPPQNQGLLPRSDAPQAAPWATPEEDSPPKKS